MGPAVASLPLRGISFDRHFVLVSHLIALVGVAALQTTHQVGFTYVALALAALLWSGLRGWRGSGFEIPEPLANGAMLVALGVILAPVFAAGAPPIRAIAEFMLVLSALKGLAIKHNRDWLQIHVLAFFQLVSASALTVEPVFALLFVVYLLLAPWGLVLFLLRREVTAAGGAWRLEQEPFVEPTLFRSVAAVTVVLFLSTLLIFVFFPRMGVGYFANPLASGSRLTGFSDEVGLGDVSALKEDATVAMRASISPEERLADGAPYWRGAVLDTFDGQRWRRSHRGLHSLPRAEPLLFVAAEGASPKTLVREEIILEPHESTTLFALGRVLEIRGRFPGVLIDSLGGIRAAGGSGARRRYEVLASMGPRPEPPTLESREVPPVDRRIIERARAETAGLRRDTARAEALLRYFKPANGFRYTLQPGDAGKQDPLARFLFETRRGHCEYFASALAVMLRAVGIPSVIIGGYYGGEWNPYGGYFVVRQSNAHSWVEAWVDGAWRIFDPTPAGDGAPQLHQTGLAGLLDAWRMRWYRYVVNYELADQIGLAFFLRDSSIKLGEGLSGEGFRAAWEWLLSGLSRETASPGRRTVLFGALALLAAVVALALRLMTLRNRRSDAADVRAARHYRRLLHHLERRGLRKRPAETPREFCHRAAPRLGDGGADLERLTELYYEARFSGRPANGAEEEIERLLPRLLALRPTAGGEGSTPRRGG